MMNVVLMCGTVKMPSPTYGKKDLQKQAEARIGLLDINRPKKTALKSSKPRRRIRVSNRCPW